MTGGRPAAADGRRGDRRGGWVRRGVRLGVTDVRRRVRRLLAAPRSTAVRAAFYLGLWLWAIEPWEGRGAEGVATPGARGEVDLLLATRGGIALLWVGLVGLEATSATTSLDDLDASAAVVPAAGVRATLLGIQLAEHARRLGLLGVVAVMGLASLALGTGAPLVVGSGLVAFLALTATARLAGETVGMAYAAVAGGDALGRYAPVAAMAALLVGSVVVVRWFGRLAGLVDWLPPAWYADLMLLGTPGVDPDPARAAAAVVVTAAALPALFLVAERLAHHVWFDPPAGADAARGGAGRRELPTTTRLAARLAALAPVGRPTRAVAWRATVRAFRQPSSLVMMALPVLLGVALVVSSDHAHGWLPVVLAFYGAWAAGAGVTLNPLASEGPGLPALLTAPVTGRQVVAAYVLTGLGLAAPLVVVVPLVAGVYAASGPVTLGGAVVLGLLVAAAGSAVAVGVGFVLPRLGAMSPTAVDAPAAPQRVAFVAYSLATALVAAPGVAGLLVEGAALPVPPGVVAAAGLAGTALLGAVLGGVAARYAAGRLDAYELSA